MSDSERNRIDFPSRMLALGAELNAKAGDLWSMVCPSAAVDPNVPAWRRNPHELGARRSWVPALGKIVWEIPKEFETRAYYAYICQASDGRQIGYVRVPDYNYNKDAANLFEEVIARFESTTGAMVLDQINNLGGSMFHMYALLSFLADRPLVLPQHEITIDEDYAAVAADVVANAEAGEAVPPDERPSPERVAYSRFVLSERAAGRGTSDRLSGPVYLEGVAEILPAKTRYTKKIVVLINELDFSAPEFLAAILQDNKRATLFGKRTAGAGGCAKRITFPENQLGLDYMTLTWTMAWRTKQGVLDPQTAAAVLAYQKKHGLPSGQPIEDIGVHPDVGYSLTVQDLQSGYVGYRRALLATINA